MLKESTPGSGALPPILIVDDEGKWINALVVSAETMSLPYEQTRTQDEAVEKIEAGHVSAVIMGGLQGGWKQIVAAAKPKRITPVLLTRSSVVAASAFEQGISVVRKNDFEPLKNRILRDIIVAALHPKDEPTFISPPAKKRGR